MKKIIKPKVQKISINKNLDELIEKSKSEESLEKTKRSPMKINPNLLVTKLLNHSKKNIYQLQQDKLNRKKRSRKGLGNHQLQNDAVNQTNNSRKSIKNVKIQSFNRTEKSNKIVFLRRKFQKNKAASNSKHPKMLQLNERFHQTQQDIQMSLNSNKQNHKNSLQNIRSSLTSNNQSKKLGNLRKLFKGKKASEKVFIKQPKQSNFFEFDFPQQGSLNDIVQPSENDNKLFYSLLKKKILKFYQLFLMEKPSDFQISQENILNELDILQNFIQQKLQFYESFNSTNFPSDVLTDRKKNIKKQKIQSLINTKYEENTVKSYSNTEYGTFIMEDVRNKKIDQLEQLLDQQKLDSQKQISQLKFEINEKEQQNIDLRKQILKLKIQIQQNIANSSKQNSRPSTTQKINRFSISNILQKNKEEDSMQKDHRELSIKLKKERQKYELKLQKLNKEKQQQEKQIQDQQTLNKKIRQQDDQIVNLTRQIEMFKNQLQINLEQSYSNPNLAQYCLFNPSFKKITSLQLSNQNSIPSCNDYYENPFKSDVISQNGNTEDIEEIELSENIMSEAEVQSNTNNEQSKIQLYYQKFSIKLY